MQLPKILQEICSRVYYREPSQAFSPQWCHFRKFDPAQICIVRQNHRIIESDVYNPVRARNARRGSIQVANPA